jgi:hypothetical protein
LTPIDPQVETPYEVIPNHFLQKADQVQIDEIKSMLRMFTASSPYISPYEHDVLAKPGGWECKALPSENWRYWIIYFQGTNAELQELGYALSLMENDIELGFYFMSLKKRSDAFRWHSQYLHTYFNDHDRRVLSPQKITSVDLQPAGDCYSKLKSIPEQYPHIKRAFQRFDMLKSVPLSSELTIIGLFSVIESLLTHAPKKTDSTDSLVRQIKHKIPLVRKRFRRPIDHNSIFENSISEDALWSRLYGFRSKIVHGESADLSGDIRVLRDRVTVVIFLREIVKLLLIQSLDEPILMSDLKEC